MALRRARRVARHKAKVAAKVAQRKQAHPRKLKVKATVGTHGTHGVQHPAQKRLAEDAAVRKAVHAQGGRL
jgi:hypothetical protein